MVNKQYDDIISKFSKVFSDSIKDNLSKKFSQEDNSDIQFNISELSQINDNEDIEKLKNNVAICKLDYSVGSNQKSLMFFLPNELVIWLSNSLNKKDTETSIEKLSEPDIYLISELFQSIFKNIEKNIKLKHNCDLIFSSNLLLLLETSSGYNTILDDISLDLVCSIKLNLNEHTEYNLPIFLNSNIMDALIINLATSQLNSEKIKKDKDRLTVERLSDININITAELGQSQVPIKYALELVKGSLVELNTLNNSDIKVFANGVEFAYAQVVAVDNNFGLKITKIIPPKEIHK
jgi:flagellar motor switch protein FliN/FliY